jgi:uncharacterized protein (DUF433 family)
LSFPKGICVSGGGYTYREIDIVCETWTIRRSSRWIRGSAAGPRIRGTRITVGDVLEYLASGMTYAETPADFPQLSETDILACLAFATDRERKMETVSA